MNDRSRETLPENVVGGPFDSWRRQEPHHEEPPTYGGPRIELLVVPDCPHATLAETLLRVTLNELCLPHVPVLTTVVETMSDAIRRGFTGSPTIMINGIDPWAPPDGKPALACRLYPSSAGTPTQYSLARALCAAVLDDHRLPRRQDVEGSDLGVDAELDRDDDRVGVRLKAVAQGDGDADAAERFSHRRKL